VTGAAQLLLQATKIPKGTFTVIIDKITLLVEDIKKEMKNDEKERDTAIAKMHELEGKIQQTTHKKTNLEAKQESLNAEIEELTAKLERLNTENAELEDSIKSAGASRSQENAEFQKEQANLADSVKILKKTVTVLAQFYEKNAFLQQPAGLKTYEKNAGGTKVLAMINKIISDAEQQQALGISTENSQQTAYEKVVKEMNLTIDANNAQVIDTEEQKAQAKADLTSTEDSLKSATNTLENQNMELSTVTADSDFLRKNFDLRQEHAITEIDWFKQLQL